MKWKRKKLNIVLILIFIVSLAFIYVEKQPLLIVYSSVYSTSEETEVHLYVQMNTFLKVDKNVLTEEIIREHRKVNQPEGKVIYTLHLYRTEWNYKRNCEYDTIKCDENGAIICCEDYLGV